MDAELTIKNYRCFPDSRPARLVIRDGFTAFLGVNNSGKSSLLKFFYEFRALFTMLSGPTGPFIGALKWTPQAFNPPVTRTDPEEWFYNGNERPIEITVDLIDPSLQRRPMPALKRLIVTIPRASNTFVLSTELPTGREHFKDLSLDFTDHTLLRVNGNVEKDLAPHMELFRDLASTLYIGPFRNTINLGTNAAYFDIQVGQSFISHWRSVKTGPSKKQNEAAYKLTEDILRIFEYKHLEINAASGDQTLQFLVNGKSYTLLELGSGLAQFVLVLANAATNRSAFIFIDEPELNLHPSLQLDFLTTLGSYASRGVLFATHSYGLARARAQSVYTLRYDPDAGSEMKPLESTPRLSELLGELSFSAYRELGFDQVLLVEGVTEVLTIQQFLRMYGKDHKIVLLPLGGASLINGSRELELQEIMRITSRVHALIDSERSGPGAPLGKDRTDFDQVCKNVGIPLCVLDRRATENYLTDAAVKAVMGPKYRALGSHEPLKTPDPTWGKGDNFKIARAMSRADIDSTDLGKFLNSL